MQKEEIVKIKSIIYLLALALCFNGYFVSAQSASQEQQPPGKELRSPDVVFVPTPYEAVEAMLKVAKVGKSDIVYDLGSGDGRIPIMAVQKYNAARAVGIDINPERIKEAEANLKAAGVGDRVRFLNEDLFEANISDATVVTLYLLPGLNLKLLPKLLTELKPGTRIVSHAFDMGSWKPQQTLNASGSTVYFWTIPAKGTPEYTAAAEAAKQN
jgi:SAM-dependent methyltransferase